MIWEIIRYGIFALFLCLTCFFVYRQKHEYLLWLYFISISKLCLLSYNYMESVQGRCHRYAFLHTVSPSKQSDFGCT